MAERNGWVVKWLVGALWGALVFVILFIGNTVKANDVKSTDEHTDIRKEYASGDEKTRNEVRVELKEIRAVQQQQVVQMAKNKESLMGKMARNKEFLKDQMAEDKMEILVAIESLKK